LAGAGIKQDGVIEAARQAYEQYDYGRSVELLQAAVKKDPQNGDIHLQLAKSYYEMEQWDAAAASAERAVEINPNNSNYHEWLGRAYGEKADRAVAFSALSLARKTHNELETAVRLDERNFSAAQALIEYDCRAPGIAGGGEDKARPLIARLAEMDPAEGHYAEGNCRRQKKDNATAEVEFTKALESKPKSADLIYDIADHEMKRGQPDRLLKVVEAGEELDASDPRGEFYRGVALVLKGETPEEAGRLFRQYLKKLPIRTGYPRPADAHYWIGRLYEGQNNAQAAAEEYEMALKLDAKNRLAREALKKMGKG
jgi:tetratricopeptide (TPR) repeat protein